MLGVMDYFDVKTLLVGLVVGYLALLVRKWWRYRLPPGPFALHIIGNMLQFKTKMIHKDLFEWSKTYGPVMSVYLGSTMAIVVNDITTANEVLVKKDSDFAGRMTLPSTEALSSNGKDIAFGQYGPIWRLHRQISSKALRQYMKGNALEKRIHDFLPVAIKDIEKETCPFDVDKYLKLIFGNILYGLCFGSTHGYDTVHVNRLLELFEEMTVIIGGGGPLEDMVPGIKYFWESSEMKLFRVGMDEVIKPFLEVKYQDHVKTFDVNNMRDVLDMLILARKEAENDSDEKHLDKLTDIHIMMTIFDIFFAGIHTSRTTLHYAILYMVAYPEIQTKVQEEIDRIVPSDGLPKLCHKPQLSYTEAVLYECMRLVTIAPTATHKAMCDTTITGYDVPKDTMVIINIWALHHDAAAWERVENFLPERFLDADGKLGPKPKSWLPFSAGKRVCLGETVAKPELLLTFAALMQRFTWRVSEGVTIDLSPIGSSFILTPKMYDFIVEKRNITKE